MTRSMAQPCTTTAGPGRPGTKLSTDRLVRQRSAPDEPTGGSASSPWVLLVEDDAFLARAVTRGLRRRGFRVTWASTLSQARLALASATFDAVLLDVHLPDGTGHELLRSPTPPGRPRPRFVATSGEASRTEVDELRALGVVGYHPKPVVFDELAMDLRGGRGGSAASPA